MTTADNNPLSFACPNCYKHLQSPATQAGAQASCPHCHASLRIPFRSRGDEKQELYSLQGDSGSLSKEQETSVPVRCSVCHSRLLAKESEIGKKIVCPDCGTSNVVEPPPKEPPKKPRRTAEQIGEYPLAEEVGYKPDETAAAEQEYIPVICTLCHTRMLAEPNQVGSRMICPDCGSATVVPPMPPKRKKIDVMAGAEDGYKLAGYDDARPQATAPQPVLTRDEPSEPEPRLVPRRKRRKLPDHPFLENTFTFPFAPTVRGRTFLLTGWMLVFATIQIFSKLAGDKENPITWFLCAMLSGIAVVMGLIWFAIAAATVLTILRETAEGLDEIEDWPGSVFLDWMGECVWLFCAMCMSATPGAALVWLLGRNDMLGVFLMGGSSFIFFPFVLLSMLETDSIVGIVSWPVLRTVFNATLGWIGFYVSALLLFAGLGGIDTLAVYLNPYFGIVVASITQSLLWIIYFRLIGRLAWYCTVRSARADLEDAIDSVLDEDDEDEGFLDEEDLLS